MGKEIKLFKTQERKSKTDVSAFLHQLADKVSSGQIILKRGKEEITLEFPDNLILEVQAEDEKKGKKGIQHSLEIEIKWFENDQGGSLEIK